MRPAVKSGPPRRAHDSAAALLFVALIVPGGASATTFDEASTLCEEELRTNRGAIALRELQVRRDNGTPLVYGYADFADQAEVRFRCRVYQGSVRAVQYLVTLPDTAPDRVWRAERPREATPASPPEVDAETVREQPQQGPGPLFRRPRGAAPAKPEIEADANPGQPQDSSRPLFLRPRLHE